MSAPQAAEPEGPRPVTGVVTPIRLDYRYSPGRAASHFLGGVAEGKLLAQRCPSCAKVYIPPRGSCPMCGVATTDDVELTGAGTVVTYAIVRVPVPGRKLEIPYACANVVLDGADVTTTVLLQEVALEEIRLGMRVEPVWLPEAERGPTMASVSHFRPSDEPDAPFESYKEFV